MAVLVAVVGSSRGRHRAAVALLFIASSAAVTLSAFVTVFATGPGPVPLSLPERWRVEGPPGDVFVSVSSIATDREGRVYVMDLRVGEVTMWSASGKFVARFGHPGKGPGDIKPNSFLFLSDAQELGIAERRPPRVQFLRLNGDYVRRVDLTVDADALTAELTRIEPGPDFLMVQSSIVYRDRSVVRLSRLSTDGKELARYSDVETGIGQTRLPHKILFGAPRWTVTTAGRLVASLAPEGYALMVWDGKGTMAHCLRRDYERLPRTPAERDALAAMDKETGSKNEQNNLIADVSSFHRDIESVHATSGDFVMVLTSRGAREIPEGSMGVFDVFTGAGDFVENVDLRGVGSPLLDRYIFDRDALYVVTEGHGNPFGYAPPERDVERMTVVCYDLGPLLRRARR